MKKLLILAALALLSAVPALAQNNSSYYWEHGKNPLLRESLATAPSSNTILYYDGTQFDNVTFSDYLDALGGTSLTELNKLDGVTATTAQIEAVTSDPGRGWFNICGEATTINNNTVYYGPNISLLASSGNGQTCDINAAGSTTEATADAAAFTNQAVQVLGMVCRNEADANADISFTLRTAEGATVPSVTCTIADGERDCVADIQTTTAIAAGATVAVAAASTGDIADANGFVCTVSVAY